MKTSRFVGFVMLAVLLHLSACHKFASDAKLKRNFIAHRQDFEKLLAMVESDRNYRRIHYSPANIGPKDMSAIKFQQYQKLFGSSGLKIGVNRYAEFPRAVFFAADAATPESGALIKGYTYCQCELRPILPETQEPLPSSAKDADGKHFIVFSPIEPGWYLFSSSEMASFTRQV